MKHSTRPRAWAVALAAGMLSVAPVSASGEAEPTGNTRAAAAFLRDAILEAARNGQADPVQTVFGQLRDKAGVDVELPLDTGTRQPAAPSDLRCPDGISTGDCRAFQNYAFGPGDGYDGEGHDLGITLIDLDGDGRRDLVSDYYTGGTGLYSAIELIRQDPVRGFGPSRGESESRRQRMSYSINGRGGDQAFEILRIHGTSYAVYRDSFYALDTITLEMPFAPVEESARIEVRYRHRHRATQDGSEPEATRHDPATASLLAAVNQALSDRAWNDPDIGSETDRCPSDPEVDGQWPWHGAGHYSTEFTWSFPVRSAGKCLGATIVNFLGSYRTDQSACCAVWIYGPGYEEIATFHLATERRVISVEAGERGDPGPGLFD
ncbi:hypothetical protein [Luteimonas lutimaris]|uniref:VCBS repeat-containing protein n=1 Tax=Luteimonas lutimaris TaxID=698645 RepID=A0ABP7N2C8_9GAMM|nr:hypothetical protein [Luteimonas sp.]